MRENLPKIKEIEIRGEKIYIKLEPRDELIEVSQIIVNNKGDLKKVELLVEKSIELARKTYNEVRETVESIIKTLKRLTEKHKAPVKIDGKTLIENIARTTGASYKGTKYIQLTKEIDSYNVTITLTIKRNIIVEPPKNN